MIIELEFKTEKNENAFSFEENVMEKLQKVYCGYQ